MLFRSEVVGIHAAKRGTRFEALEPIRQGVRHSFGAFGKGVAQGLTLRHDHGSQFIADDFQNEIKFLGIKDSASYVREPQGNGIAERFVRLLKENLLWVRSFDTVEALRLALLAFKESYNQQCVSAGMAIVHRLRSGNSRRLRSPRPPNFRGQTVQGTLDRYTASFEPVTSVWPNSNWSSYSMPWPSI